jgi:phosphate starvation-inducible PhoH-like protein
LKDKMRKASRYQERHPEARKLKPIEAMNDKQQEYIECIVNSPQTIVMGPAGTGKTFIAAAIAANKLRIGEISKIILTRPNVPAGRSLGFLPGTMDEKIGPWVVPFTDVIREYLGDEVYGIHMRKKNIDIVPFEVMRGRTFNDAFIILDEAQNTLPAEMKMFLTRIGERSTVVINGDVKQPDLKADSGLKTILGMIEKQKLPVPVVEFGTEHIVRSDICAMWIKAFDKEGI